LHIFAAAHFCSSFLIFSRTTIKHQAKLVYQGHNFSAFELFLQQYLLSFYILEGTVPPGYIDMCFYGIPYDIL